MSEVTDEKYHEATETSAAAASTAKAEASRAARRRGRIVLAGLALVVVALIVGPQLLRWRLERDLCPTTVLRQGNVDGAQWDVARSDCGGGRIVWQLRLVPQKGVSTPVYEAEGGPEPLDWTQTGFTGTLRLTRPLDGEETADHAVTLDIKGRPAGVLRARDGRRVPAL